MLQSAQLTSETHRGKLAGFREAGMSRIHMKVLTEIADDLELKSCESELLNVWHVADLCVKYSLWIQSLCGQLIPLTDSQFELQFVLDILLKGPFPSSPTGVFQLISHIPLSHNLVLSALK